MACNYYLAVDIGASSGRHIIGYLENGLIKTKEMYRFTNRLYKKNGYLCWDFELLFTEILNGLKKCKEENMIPSSMGIDTWGVDFVLLDENNKVIGDTVSYRDPRTKGADEEIFKIVPEEELYARTGIQRVDFNTINQFWAIKKNHPEYFERAKRFLMTPEYFNFLLTGVCMNEYTNASTTQMVNAKKATWDFELMEKLGYPTSIFGKLNSPGTSVGMFKKEIVEMVGFDCEVVLPCTHDTGSAVLSLPMGKGDSGFDSVFISSGTWSLVGIERSEPDCSAQSMKLNFSNEGGYDLRYRYLKNIMGLWMIQSVKRELEEKGEKYTFDELCDMAIAEEGFPSRLDVDSTIFLAPDSMIEAIKDYCAKTSQKVPENNGQLLSAIYQSLAGTYARVADDLEKMTGTKFHSIKIVGGGCNDEYLSRLTARLSGRKVYAGPKEATSIGNLCAQMIKAGELENLRHAREKIHDSFAVKEYTK
ncbi:MAG: rhamnulokinase [Ruminococcaceae bacterium]|nr:rhamnulokinase [Oscillospiraceae bacterium]